MIRKTIVPRKDWQKKVEKQGLIYHSDNGVKYWDEFAYYSFTVQEIELLESSTNKLHQLCLQAAQHIIDEKRYKELGIPEFIVPLIEKTWNEEPPALYGRFDLVYDGVHPPKMLEYNADTPTSLLEAAVIQWTWLEDVFPKLDQFNSIHDKLLRKFKELKKYFFLGPVYFTSMDTWEDYLTISYLRDVAEQSGFLGFGLKTQPIKLEDIGWDSQHRCFADQEGRKISNIFKLYPWEWLIHEEFGQYLLETSDQMYWMEPAWKMLLSNKGILAILWELFPEHPNLLPSYLERPESMISYAKKPLLSREGANVELVTPHSVFRSSGDYGEEGYVYQQLCTLPIFEGNYPVIGSWMIDQEAAGIGIRESSSLITDNMSRFVPHVIED